MRSQDAVVPGPITGRGPLQFNVGGLVLLCSRSLWRQLEGPKPALPMEWESDGCSHSPDKWRGFKLWPACVIHDYHYRFPTPLTRQQADDALYRNIQRLVLAQGGGSFSAKRIAWLYWGRVRLWGVDAWQHWGPGRKPKGFWARLREVY